MTRIVMVLGDQLSRASGALARADPCRDRVVMVEPWAKLTERPWHRQKLCWDLMSRHRQALSANPRTARVLGELDRFSDAERHRIRAPARRFRTDASTEPEPGR